MRDLKKAASIAVEKKVIGMYSKYLQLKTTNVLVFVFLKTFQQYIMHFLPIGIWRNADAYTLSFK